MRIAIGYKLRQQAWGGGNQVGLALSEYLRERGEEVVFGLDSPNIDIILLTEPRSNLAVSAFSDVDVRRYIKRVHPRALVVHRVNECDERKGTRGVNERLIVANRCADHTVFVATWLSELFMGKGWPCKSTSVIPNGSDRRIFNPDGYRPWTGDGPLKLVTHHWGSHRLKGFDVYERLDAMLADPHYQGRVTFTYIGNLPKGFEFQNARYEAPLHGKDLARLLREHHVYLTGSQFEPGGNHQNEGGNCGLPILYRDSGCLPEYCEGYGVCYTLSSFESKLEEMIKDYRLYVDRMPEFPRTVETMCGAYHALFKELLANRERLMSERSKAGVLERIRSAFRRR